MRDTAEMEDRNVLGGRLEPCGNDPVTGFFRDGCCHTSPEDRGSHTICAVVTAEFLQHQQQMGNDLSTPMLQYGFPGLVPGDRWWVTAVNWLRAHHDGAAAYVVLVSSSSGLWRSCPWRHSKSTPSMYRPVPVASKVIVFVTPVSVRGRRSPVGRSDVIHDLGIAVRARGSIRIPNGYHTVSYTHLT